MVSKAAEKIGGFAKPPIKTDKAAALMEKLDKVIERKNEANGKVREVWNEVKEAGFDKKDFLLAYDVRNAKISEDSQRNVNDILKAIGQTPLFSLSKAH